MAAGTPPKKCVAPITATSVPKNLVQISLGYPLAHIRPHSYTAAQSARPFILAATPQFSALPGAAGTVYMATYGLL